jgi:aspartate carbamoyltransferase catalytic subunit
MVYKMNRQEVLEFIKYVDKMKNPLRQYPKKTVIHYLCEPNRATDSFKVASNRLGCKVLNIEYSTTETLEDMVKTIQHYGDAMILKHPDADSYTRALAVSRIPILQSGIHCHKTQTLIDIYTIYKELKYRGIYLECENRQQIHVTFLGYSRHTQSLVTLLNLFPKIECHFVKSTSDPDMIVTDVLYVSTKQEDDSYCVNKEFISITKPTMIIMHSLPRQEEIAKEIDTNPRSVYFHQSENGIYVRMALLDKLFSIRTYPTLSEYFWMFMSKVTSILCFGR